MRWKVWGILIALSLTGCGSDDPDDVDIIEDPLPTVGDLTVVGFNVESGDSNPLVVAEQMRQVQGESLWGLSEVESDSWGEIFESAAERGENADFRRILGTTGGADKLVILYDSRVLELRRQFELHDINVGGNVRAPLVGDFRIRQSGLQFLFMVNHLYRSREDRRHEQAQRLNDWARGQTLPVIAVGDYNFDWEVFGGETKHDRGYDLMTAGGIWRWIRPPQLIKTQCSSSYNSVLDFVFAAGAARNWPSSSEILNRETSYCQDTDQSSDHRMIRAVFDVP